MAPDQVCSGSSIIENIQATLSPETEVCDMTVADFGTELFPDQEKVVQSAKDEDEEEEKKGESVLPSGVSPDGIPKPCMQLHPPDEVRLEWLKVQKVGAGLVNLGNSCFLNTVVQCLTYCPPLANYLLRDDHITHCKNYEFCMMCELAKHIKEALRRSGDVIKPMCIYQNLKYIADHFQFGRQEDAHEYLRFVIENLWRASLNSHDDKKLDPASRETTIINHIFGGYSRSQVMCLRCKQESSKYEHFMDFILDIKHNSHTLEKALEQFVKPEILENENAYSCPRCETLVQAEKTFTIHRAPNVATIQLKRFDYNYSLGGKITKHVSYPEKLNLRPYMSEMKEYPIFYKLNAVLVHAGQSCNSGHYYCYIRNSNGRWYLMDDTRVQRVSLNDVLNQQAYVLFYVQIPQQNGTRLNQEDPLTNVNNTCSSGYDIKVPLEMQKAQRPSRLDLDERLRKTDAESDSETQSSGRSTAKEQDRHERRDERATSKHRDGTLKRRSCSTNSSRSHPSSGRSSSERRGHHYGRHTDHTYSSKRYPSHPYRSKEYYHYYKNDGRSYTHSYHWQRYEKKSKDNLYRFHPYKPPYNRDAYYGGYKSYGRYESKQDASHYYSKHNSGYHKERWNGLWNKKLHYNKKFPGEGCNKSAGPYNLQRNHPYPIAVGGHGR